jgi:hypothetical protein
MNKSRPLAASKDKSTMRCCLVRTNFGVGEYSHLSDLEVHQTCCIISLHCIHDKCLLKHSLWLSSSSTLSKQNKKAWQLAHVTFMTFHCLSLSVQRTKIDETIEWSWTTQSYVLQLGMWHYRPIVKVKQFVLKKQNGNINFFLLTICWYISD